MSSMTEESRMPPGRLKMADIQRSGRSFDDYFGFKFSSLLVQLHHLLPRYSLNLSTSQDPRFEAYQASAEFE